MCCRVIERHTEVVEGNHPLKTLRYSSQKFLFGQAVHQRVIDLQEHAIALLKSSDTLQGILQVRLRAFSFQFGGSPRSKDFYQIDGAFIAFHGLVVDDRDMSNHSAALVQHRDPEIAFSAQLGERSV